jgi:transcriptional regulator with XRE-family HTH domain
MSTPDGPKVREMRRARRWTQTELGRKVGRKKSIISRAESGLPVSVTLMRQIAAVFHVDLADIEIPAKGDEQDEPQPLAAAS